jgi:hypothetical protein
MLGLPGEGAPVSLGEEERLQAFRDVRDELRRRICVLFPP